MSKTNVIICRDCPEPTHNRTERCGPCRQKFLKSCEREEANGGWPLRDELPTSDPIGDIDESSHS